MIENDYGFFLNTPQYSSELFNLQSLEKCSIPRGLFFKIFEDLDSDRTTTEQDERCFDLASSYQVIIDALGKIENSLELEKFLTLGSRNIAILFSIETGECLDCQYVLYDESEIKIMICTALQSYLGFVNGDCVHRVPYDSTTALKIIEITQHLWKLFNERGYFKTHNIDNNTVVVYIR